MLKLTIVGRVNDGLPLAQDPKYANEQVNIDAISSYKQQAEFLLQEISRGALPCSKMNIVLDVHCFNYIVENGICFLVMCDLSYPRKLAFCYLQDLKSEFDKFDVRLADRVSRPYSFTQFDSIIGSTRMKYIETRTQVNLSKMYSDRSQELGVVSERFSLILKRRKRFDMLERMSVAHLNSSPIWCSKRLEIITLKWIPIGIALAVVISVLICIGLIN